LFNRLRAERAWGEETAARVTLALHPLDDAAVPSGGYESALRKRSRKLSKRLRNASEAQADALALRALHHYRRLAVSMAEHYYAERYDVVIDGAFDQGVVGDHVSAEREAWMSRRPQTVTGRSQPEQTEPFPVGQSMG
jgi:hypothetical protein